MPKRTSLFSILAVLMLAACAAGGSMSGYVWDDYNGDGIQNSDEPGVSGVEVALIADDGRVLVRANTDDDGNYSLNVTRNPDYDADKLSHIQVSAPSGYGFTKIDQGDNEARDSDVDSLGRSIADIYDADRLDAGLLKLPDAPLTEQPTEVPTVVAEATATPSGESQAATFGPFLDGTSDEYFCNDGADVSDAPVDILEVFAEQLEDGVRVTVVLRASAEDAANDYSYSVQARIGQSGGYQVGIYEYHDSVPRIGRLETTEDVYPDTERDVHVEGDSVQFFFPDATLAEGDTLTARSFHLPTANDQTRCDVTEAFETN